MSASFSSNGHRSNGESSSPRRRFPELDPSNIPPVENEMPAAVIMKEDEEAHAALSFIDRIAGDAEALIQHVHEGFGAVGLPRGIRDFALRDDVEVEPEETLSDGRRVYRCMVTDQRFAVAADANLPVLEMIRDDDEESASLQRIVLHPEIVADGNDAVIRALGLLASDVLMKALQYLRMGLEIEEGLWDSEGEVSVDAQWPDPVDWEPVDAPPDDETDAAS
jgi:hypothetical protein